MCEPENEATIAYQVLHSQLLFSHFFVLDENAQLKEQIAAMQTSATQLELVKNCLHQSA